MYFRSPQQYSEIVVRYILCASIFSPLYTLQHDLYGSKYAFEILICLTMAFSRNFNFAFKAKPNSWWITKVRNFWYTNVAEKCLQTCFLFLSLFLCVWCVPQRVKIICICYCVILKLFNFEFSFFLNCSHFADGRKMKSVI